MSRGKYICIEGVDGSGKSTLVAELIIELGLAAGQTFPSGGRIGSLIRSALRGDSELPSKAFLYLFCADGFEQQAGIEERLESGFDVVVDRHPTMSGRVFQLEHHAVQEIEAVYGAADRDGLLRPDHLFILDAPADVLMTRMKSREKYKDVVFEKDDIKHVETIRQRYLQLADRFGGVVLDATRSIKELAADIRIVVNSNKKVTAARESQRQRNECG